MNAVKRPLGAELYEESELGCPQSVGGRGTPSESSHGMSPSACQPGWLATPAAGHALVSDVPVPELDRSSALRAPRPGATLGAEALRDLRTNPDSRATTHMDGVQHRPAIISGSRRHQSSP